MFVSVHFKIIYFSSTHLLLFLLVVVSMFVLRIGFPEMDGQNQCHLF